jgi:DNA-binding GntR family transcriptional regulator
VTDRSGRSSFQLTAVNASSTTEQVAAALRTAILQGKLSQGEQLSEAILAPTFRVSRGSVREALLMLVGDRLVDHRPRQGFFVAQLDSDDIREVYEVRLAIESAAGHLMIARQDVSITQDLEEHLERFREAVAADDWTAIGDADLRFHQLFVAGARNSRLDRVMSLILYETRICMADLEGTYERPEDLVAEHEELIRALKLRDGALLAFLQRQHMEGAVRRLSPRALPVAPHRSRT